MSVAAVYEQLMAAQVSFIVGVPDSMLAPLHALAASRDEICYLQVADEATAVGLAAGVRLAGGRSLVLMESSGLRRACETLARLTLGHRLHLLMLLSRRGAFGERNWWAIPHEDTMQAHLRMLPTLSHELDSVAEFGPLLRRGYDSLDTGQRSVALVANQPFLAELGDAR
ncbi:MAG: sulfopyruvate decarboxylase subunit alpha [Pseudonocardiales bacterium]|jgi:sulfopyruvate decarboxylase TPP-binding subunit|nr:sulfopyruvate decarboxylase subunit alpha [Pseudonocardiales bacterium]